MSLILPSEINWKEVVDQKLEELLYWLFDSMGAKDLEWRVGSSGRGSADQGRDLELTFFVDTPVGDIEPQRWWVEAKGRTGTVTPLDIKESINNTSARKDIDVFLIATNSTFSNPTRNWVAEFQQNHVRPRIKLWDRTDLERHCSKNPLAVIRLFNQALSPQGKLEALRERFWSYASFAPRPVLEEIWQSKDGLEIEPFSLLALIASENANGSIEIRSWPKIVSRSLSLDALANGLLNYPYWMQRADAGGSPQEPVIQGLAYLILIATIEYGHEDVTQFLHKIWGQDPELRFSFEMKEILLEPILQTLNDEVRDVCISDCKRLSTERRFLSEQQVDVYWQRMQAESIVENRRAEWLSIESFAAPCKVGFRLGKKRHCPVNHTGQLTKDIGGFLKRMQQIATSRMNENSG